MVQKHFRLHRLTIFTVFWLNLIFFPQKAFPISEITAAENTVIVIQSQQIPAYNEAIKGFEEGCKGKNISIKAVYDLKGNMDEGKKVIRSLKEDKLKPNLVLAIGILATIFAKEQFSDIPIIFCMVINHERFNLQEANISGISSEASIEDQFTMLKEMLGTHKSIGVIYNSTESRKIISEATHVAKRFEFNLITAEVVSERDVASALNNVIKKIDVLWIIPDGTVITKNSLDAILKGTMKYNIPTFCTSSALVKAGILASISMDYTSTGLQAAQMAQTLLNSPTVISLGVRRPDKLELTLNTETAERLGVNLSSIQSRPDVVFYP